MTGCLRFPARRLAGALLALLVLTLAACAEKPVRQGAAQAPQKPAALAPLAESGLDESAGARQLRAKIEALASDPKYAGSRLGVYVQSLAGNAALARINAHEPMAPASNMKLFTTAASLYYLSPAYRYATVLAASGPVKAGTLTGDLIVVGSGDPAISGGGGYGGEGGFAMTGFAEALAAKGIKTVGGDLVGDESRFERFSYYPGWCAEDELKPYAAPSGALSLNQNCVGVVVKPGRKQGDKAEVELTPPAACFVVDNGAVTASGAKKAAAPLSVARKPASNVIEVHGRQSIRVPAREYLLTVDDPGMFFMTALAETLKNSGIRVAGKTRLSREPAAGSQTRDTLFVHYSPELRELIRTTNKKSNNFYAEQLLKTIGAQARGLGSRENGAAAVTSFMGSLGVSEKEFAMTDGSGLSLLNRVSPYSLIAFLRSKHKSEYFSDFYASLP
ncbi:MAG: D-alanyl-D-alanine carboxypeptidase/D-alanyl-D-alanine-endopeptidase, partial [Desulfovibrionaceae bacterium]|nr:D-alanyl-D-alanine carboxypeptidase/D-alanyl-D-alanine-endopeptidase [Desulfovibrionaceae bacterium]